MISQWQREIILSKAFRAPAKVQYVTNFEGVVIEPLMAIGQLAYQGDAETGKRTEAYGHEYHIWDTLIKLEK
jgi:hypothetical protein